MRNAFRELDYEVNDLFVEDFPVIQFSSLLLTGLVALGLWIGSFPTTANNLD